EGHAGGNALRPRVRTSIGCALSPGRSWSRAVRRMVRVPEPGIALLQPRLLGSHAPPRNHTVDPVLPGQSCPDLQTSNKSAGQIHPTSCGSSDFVAYVAAMGKLEGRRCLREWKTSSSRYPEEPEGLLALDPQLVFYSWMTGISEVAQVVFVRKRLAEVQY